MLSEMPAETRPSDVVMIIRHGEKPSVGPGTRGVNLAGKPDKDSLTPTGWVRAGALLDLFAPTEPNQVRTGLFRPASVFASSKRGQHGSDREEQTVALLAWKLGVKMNSEHPVGQERDLVKAVLAAPSPRIICWEHRQLPTIVQVLGTDAAVPERWPNNRYDMVWVLTREHPEEPYSFAQVPELLLPGDSELPI